MVRVLRDCRSALFYDIVLVIALCQLHNIPDVGYLLENVNSSDDTRDKFVMDSQDSCAHRLRAFWTNMVNRGQFRKAVELTHKTTTKVWSNCLEPCHRPNVTLRQEAKPFYRCNITGAQVRVEPTFVSYRGSHAFRNRGLGMVQHTATREWQELMPEERERAMGFPEGYTQVVGTSNT